MAPRHVYVQKMWSKINEFLAVPFELKQTGYSMNYENEKRKIHVISRARPFFRFIIEFHNVNIGVKKWTLLNARVVITQSQYMIFLTEHI